MANYSRQLDKFIESKPYANSAFKETDGRTWVSYYQDNDELIAHLSAPHPHLDKCTTAPKAQQRHGLHYCDDFQSRQNLAHLSEDRPCVEEN